MQRIVVYRQQRRAQCYRASRVMKPIYKYADQTTGTNKGLGILDVKLYRWVKCSRRFEGRACLHLQGEIANKKGTIT